MLEQNFQKTEQQTFQQQNEDKRVSEVTNDSEFLEIADLFINQDEEQPGPVLVSSLISQRILSKRVQNPTIGPVLLKKAVNWLISFCWTKDYSQQILWNSIGYFYAYLNCKVLKKESLTILCIFFLILVLTIVNLSLKLLEPSKALKINDLGHVLVTSSDQTLFVELQQELLEVFDFQVYFHTNLGRILTDESCREKTDEILFLCEILFMRSYDVAIDPKYLEQLLKLVNDPEGESNIKEELRGLAKSEKYLKNTKLKYSSRIDADEFWKRVIA